MLLVRLRLLFSFMLSLPFVLELYPVGNVLFCIHTVFIIRAVSVTITATTAVIDDDSSPSLRHFGVGVWSVVISLCLLCVSKQGELISKLLS